MMQRTMAQNMINEDSQFHQIKNLKSTAAGNAINQYDGSLLIIASERDAIIPSSITEGYLKLAQTNKKKLEILEGASHSLSGTKWKNIANKMASDWFTETL
jgi:esterase/lipase